MAGDLHSHAHEIQKRSQYQPFAFPSSLTALYTYSLHVSTVPFFLRTRSKFHENDTQYWTSAIMRALGLPSLQESPFGGGWRTELVK